MDLEFSTADLAFRKEMEGFVSQAFDDEIQSKLKDPDTYKDGLIQWQRRLHDQGCFAINWPKEYGGTGWNHSQKYIFANVMAENNCPPVLPFGVSMVAPVIYSYGSEEQKQRFLPDILTSTAWWCQGYSEPGSGSDLASLQTKAVLMGDHYLVNGTKTWTTLAQHADWIFCLVRTDNTGAKQAGISFLLIDMNSEGVEVAPIQMADGTHEVNSVFFTDVKVPIENLIGEENKGWTYAKVLLQHERTGIAGVANSKREIARLKLAAQDTSDGTGSNLMDDQSFVKELSEIELELLALEHTELRVLSMAKTGGSAGVQSSILKIKGVEIQQKISEMFVNTSGYYAMPFTGKKWNSNYDAVGPDFAENSTPSYLNYRKASIYGGSNEVQKQIIAKQVLGL